MSGKADTISDPVLEEATDWFYRVQSASHDPVLHTALQAWMDQDEAHARAWALVQRAWGLAGRTEPVFARQNPAVAPKARVVPSGATPLARSLPGRAKPRRRFIAAALVACLAFLIVASQLSLWLRADFATEAGESREITLEDGSQVHLSAGSAISTMFAPDRRIVALLRGEAFFRVSADAARPFSVQAEDLTVTVIGTAFDVGFTPRTFSVAVASGTVAVKYAGGDRAVALSAGDKLSIDRTSGQPVRSAIAGEDIAAWRSGRLIVENAAFADVIDAIGRHHSGLIVIADASLQQRRVTGVYDLSNPSRALRALAGPYGSVVRELTPYMLVVSAF